MSFEHVHASVEVLPDKEVLLESPLADAFERVGLPLNHVLACMLREEEDYRFDPATYDNNRKGSGFLGVGRFLAEVINRPRNVGRDWQELLDDPFGHLEEPWYRRLRERFEDEAPTRDQLFAAGTKKIAWALQQASSEAERMIAGLLADLLLPREYEDDVVELPTDPGYTIGSREFGSCTTAETYFLEKAHPRTDYARTSGTRIYDHQGRLVMWKKHGGEPTAITFAPCKLNGVVLPPGSIIGLKPKGLNASAVHIGEFVGAQFLRMSSLAISPEHRKHDVGMTLVFQQLNGMLYPESTSLEDVYRSVVQNA